VARVFVGMMDPNPKISGRGWRKLRDAGIDVQGFPKGLAAQIEELNRDFIRAQDLSETPQARKSRRRPPASEATVGRNVRATTISRSRIVTGDGNIVG
jgi:diaminohydroxyphosphoribosylaminopyrimidine deaminase / 5-amino-6-(5-phosphoribosylamino)uracil reductase